MKNKNLILFLNLMILPILLFISFNGDLLACGFGGSSGGASHRSISNLRWEVLTNCRELSFVFPKLKIQTKQCSIQDLCLSEEYLRTKKPVQEICNFEKREEYIEKFIQDFKENPSLLPSDEESECINIYHFVKIFQTNKTNNYNIIKNAIPLTYQVSVYKNTKNKRKFLFKKDYKIPQCN